MAPELPKRSNSIISLSNNCSDVKPVMSPRGMSESGMMTPARSQPIVSPKLLDAVNEERTPTGFDSTVPPTVSPRTITHGYSHSYDATYSSSVNRSPFQNAHRNCIRGGSGSSAFDDSAIEHHQTASAAYPPSPKHQNTENLNDFGPLPISPHVNVPNTHAFNHHVPPPLPPRRRERKESDAAAVAQNRQAPDAPKLPPRDISPPPLPPRLGLVHTAIKKSIATFEEVSLREHNLKLPHTSTIMMRRNSALERASKEAGTSSNALQTSNSVDGSTSISSAQEIQIKVMRQTVTSAPPVNRRPRLVSTVK